MSMFLDQTTIDVKAGNGGNGMVAFRREKFVPNGGPAGGDGGRGGDVILIVDEGLRTLMDFRYNRRFKASAGENGMHKNMHGRSSQDLYVKVPQGTIVRDKDTGELLGDLVEEGQMLTVAKGGRGGRGNVHFATPKNSAPELAENGEPGIERKIELELRVLADVGLVGFPSVGKSTLLSVISAAKPKIGAYHFTTIVPNLGMVSTSNGTNFVIADLPGLIEGASQGVGLGVQFLRHIERTRVILHVVDMSGMEGRDPYEDYLAINQELSSYDLRLLERPQIIVANKIEMPGAEDQLKEFKEKLAQQYANENSQMPLIFPTSGVTNQGIDPLVNATADLLEKAPVFPLDEKVAESEDVVQYGYTPEESSFEIQRDPDATWVLTGRKLEKQFEMTDFEHEEGIRRFTRQLRKMGVDEALRQRGAQDGDLVRIRDFVFEFVE